VRPYTEIPGFETFLLEESWVLEIEAHPRTLSIKLELALVPEHPDYTAPGPGALCHRSGMIRFGGVESLSWSHQTLQPATDATGEIDYGHIDTFDWTPEEFRLIGDFGHITLRATDVRVELTT
jgi:hypothetical protein